MASPATISKGKKRMSLLEWPGELKWSETAVFFLRLTSLLCLLNLAAASPDVFPTYRSEPGLGVAEIKNSIEIYCCSDVQKIIVIFF